MAQGRATGIVALSQRLPYSRRARGRPPVVLAAYRGLLLGDPARPPELRAADTGGRESTVPQVHQIRQQHRERHREADPEPGPHEEDPGQLDQVQQDQREEDTTAPMQRRDSPPQRGMTTYRGPTNTGNVTTYRGPTNRGGTTRSGDRADRADRAGQKRRRVERMPPWNGTPTAAPGQHPRRGRRPLRLDTLGGVVPARQRGGECQQTGGDEDGEEHRGRHSTPQEKGNLRQATPGQGSHALCHAGAANAPSDRPRA